MSNCLEVDIAFTPPADFGPRGPSWRTVFGKTTQPERAAPTSHDTLAGMAWHHALHARMCIQRRRWWQAEHWISGVRDQVIALACLRLGYPSSYAKGAHLLPINLTTALEAILVRSLNKDELQRALNAAVTALAAELARTDPALADRVRPILAEIGAIEPPSYRHPYSQADRRTHPEVDVSRRDDQVNGNR